MNRSPSHSTSTTTRTPHVARALATLLAPIMLLACGDIDELPEGEPSGPDDEEISATSQALGGKGGRYIVRFRDDMRDPARAADELTRAHGGRRAHVYDAVFKGFSAVDLPEQALFALRKNPNVLRVEEDVLVEVNAFQADPGWGLDRIDQATGTDLWFDHQLTGAGTHVYIIDSGIRGDHEEFTGRLGNGANKMWFDWSSPYQDTDGHGTAVASIAGGRTLGVARDATLHSVKVMSTGPTTWTSNIIGGLDWVASNAIQPAVANLSYSTNSGAMADAMNGLINAGVVLVTAAGNNNVDACTDVGKKVTRAIVVGSTNSGDYKASFSNWGSCVDIWAPGAAVNLATPTSSTSEGTGNGTSYAAPYVAGVAATMLQQWPLSSEATRQYLQSTATRNVLSGLGNGSLNLFLNARHRYVDIVGATTVYSKTYTTYENFTARTLGGDGNWTVTWEASLDGGPYVVVGSGHIYTRAIQPFDHHLLWLRARATSENQTVEDNYSVSVIEEQLECFDSPYGYGCP